MIPNISISKSRSKEVIKSLHRVLSKMGCYQLSFQKKVIGILSMHIRETETKNPAFNLSRGRFASERASHISNLYAV